MGKGNDSNSGVSHKIRLGFILGILFCLAMLLVAPIPQARLAFGVILVGLALLYTAIEQRMGWIADRQVNSGAGKTQTRLTSPDEIDKRLKQMRRGYYRSRSGGANSREYQYQLNKVASACRRYYERMLHTESAIITLLNTGPLRGLNPKSVVKQVHALSRQIAVLVEQLQLADQLNNFYEPDTDEAIMVRRARERLIRRADRAMEVLEGVPARLLHLTTATSSRGLEPLIEDLQRMTERLEGKADAYEAMTEQMDLEHLYARLEMEQARMER